jgi:3-methyladenine DNA glycosylase AlkD
MSTVSSILADLKSKGSEQTRKIYARHGMNPERVIGVSVADLKQIAKSIQGQQGLACDLYSTGTMDAMYLAGIVADGSKLTADQLTEWLEGAADLQMISEYTVPWLAVEHPQARELALLWMMSEKEHVATAGWCTYAGILALKPDGELDLAEIEGLLEKVVTGIGEAPDRVRNAMNTFVISVGGYVQPLLDQAKSAALRIGTVRVDVGDTACKVPLAIAYIEKIESTGKVGKKRKTMRC